MTMTLTVVVFVRITVWWQLLTLTTVLAILLAVKLSFRPVVYEDSVSIVTMSSKTYSSRHIPLACPKHR